MGSNYSVDAARIRSVPCDGKTFDPMAGYISSLLLLILTVQSTI